MSTSRAYLGAMLIAVAGILFWTFVLPMYDAVIDQRGALATRNTILEKNSSILANISALAKEYASHTSDIQRFTAIVPAKKSAPELVSSLQALASQNGLQITALTLSSSSDQTNESFQAQSIDLGLTGSYPAFKSFLVALEHNIRVIDIITIDASPTSENSPIIGFRIKGNAYFLK